MELWSDLLPLVGMMLATGLVGGILAGLLGVGGGIVIVPVLELALGILGVDPSIRMHIAVATSLSTIIPTSISSSRAHKKKNSVDTALVKKWGGYVFLGAALGSWLAAQVDSVVLAGIFATVALLVALKMLLPLGNWTIARDVPKGGASYLVPTGIGTVSSMMGIGGGTLSVPVLTLLNQPIHRAVGSAALFGLLISIPGTVGFMISGYGVPGLPLGSIGYVNLLGFIIISPATILAAPWGAWIAHSLSQRHLSMLFGFFLLIVSARMFYRTLIG